MEDMLSGMELDGKRAVASQWLQRLAEHHYGMYEHSLRVGTYARNVADTLGGYEPLVIEDIQQMGDLHDIGKLEISSDLLNRPSLTSEEYETIKKHTRVGYCYLVDSLPIAACAAGKHHPRYAVQEYPAELSRGQREAIDKYMPVITLCDFFDALMTRQSVNYAHIEKKDSKQVRSLLEREFPTANEPINILMLEHAKIVGH